MAEYGKSSSLVARCLSLAVATAVLGLAWGCGSSVPPQASMDDAAKARVQAALDNQKAFMAKKKKDDGPSRSTHRRR